MLLLVETFAYTVFDEGQHVNSEYILDQSSLLTKLLAEIQKYEIT